MQRFFLMGILAVAAYWDVRERRIPNQIIVLGWCMGLVLAWAQDGWQGLAGSALAVLATIAAGQVLYLSGTVGAGDVKLLSTAAGLLGGREFVWCLLFFALLLIPCCAVALFLAYHRDRTGQAVRPPGKWERHTMALAPVFAVSYGVSQCVLLARGFI